MFGPAPFMGGKQSFYSMIPHNGLNFCLDAGDINSYDGTGQTWVDLTGNGNSFFRGANGSAGGDDPTFNGTAGKRTSAEFFSLDGGDYFNEAAAHTFAEGWHGNNAAFTLAGVALKPSGLTVNRILSNTNASVGATGVSALLSTTGTDLRVVISVYAGGFTQLTATAGFSSGLVNTPVFFAIALDESVGANGITLQANADRATATSTYPSPTAGASNAPYQIGAQNSGGLSAAGSRHYCLAGWSRRLSNTELDAIYARLKKRFTAFP